jgi:hypothetical protein
MIDCRGSTLRWEYPPSSAGSGPVPHPLHGLTWEERFDSAQIWTSRFRTSQIPAASVFFALAGSLILLFLGAVGGASRDGGVVPTVAVVLMTTPIFLGGYLALRADLEAPTFHEIRLDRGGLAYTFAGCRPEVVATNEIATLVETSCVVQILDRHGDCLLRIYTTSPTFVARRLRSALAEVREPRGYRT